MRLYRRLQFIHTNIINLVHIALIHVQQILWLYHYGNPLQKANMVIGIDIGGTSITCGLVKDKELIQTVNYPTLADKDADTIIQNLIKCIDSIITNEVKAIGVGVPGLIYEEEGTILNINNIPAWKNFPLKQSLEAHYNIPAFVNNDANCFALGTKHFGKGQDYKNFIGMVLGTGVGGGIVINNKIHSGIFCSAGEIGCIPYKDSIFETYCASNYFFNTLNISGKEAAELANNGNVEAQKAFYELGINIGHLIANLVYTLSPEAFILGGSISQSFHLFESGIKKVMDDFPFTTISQNVAILPDNIENIAVLGAAGLYYNSL